MKWQDLVFITKWFAIWRLTLAFSSRIGYRVLDLQTTFTGGKTAQYLQNPWLWSWGNFDGEHYLSIAFRGYRDLQYFYFPLYPSTVNVFARALGVGNRIVNYHLLGVVLSLVFFFVALVTLFKLLSKKYNRNIAKTGILTCLFFPTSFYFSAFYTESLFLMLVLLMFYFYEDNNWWLVGILGALATATRMIGLVVFFAIGFEEFVKFFNLKNKNNQKFIYKKLPLLIAPGGLLAYMLYLWRRVSDPFIFSKNSYVFGEYRSKYPTPVLKTIYRYLFKIFPNLNYTYFPSVFSTSLEFISGMLVVTILLISWAVLPISWWLFAFGGFLIPALYNGFVSMPRYLLVLFPIYVILAGWLESKPKLIRYVYMCISVAGLCVATALFSSGYWIS